jgi:predicted flap endonuclease-1-like 5' DNA nuclease
MTRIKGLGPKAAAQLKLLGVTRYAQLGSLDTAQCDALDEHMGVFRGRLERDRWVEQARYLARGDTATFEREFGKLG